MPSCRQHGNYPETAFEDIGAPLTANSITLPRTGPLASRGHLSGNRCQLNRSTQHFLEVYSQESEILKSFLGVD
ncbi:MAG: hypothetical protein ABR953_05640, partial [Candidatus Acidiferrales bacterium]